MELAIFHTECFECAHSLTPMAITRENPLGQGYFCENLDCQYFNLIVDPYEYTGLGCFRGSGIGDG